MTAMLDRARQTYARHRGLLGKFVFELVIVFVGVTGAFALENGRQQAEETAYRVRVIDALRPTLADVREHSGEIDRTITEKLAAFDSALARGEQPPLPVYREDGAERPPTRVWDGVVATGAVKTLEPGLLFRLAQFYNRLDSFGDRYARYNAFTESQVFGLGSDGADLYEQGALKPEFRGYVQQLRSLQAANRALIADSSGLEKALAKGR